MKHETDIMKKIGKDKIEETENYILEETWST